MVTLDELREALKTKDIKEITQQTNIGSDSGLSPNYACSKIVDIIFDVIIELMNKDAKTSGFQKALVVGFSKKSKEPIKGYILNNMKREDAVNVIKKVKTVLEVVES